MYRKDSFGWSVAAIGILLGNLVGWGAVVALVFNALGDAKVVLGGEALAFLCRYFASIVLFCGVFSFIVLAFDLFERQEKESWLDWLLTLGCVSIQAVVFLLTGNQLW